MAAMAAGPALAQEWIDTGHYTGDWTSPRAITGLNFQPDLVIVKGDNNESAVIRMATMGPTISRELGDVNVYYTDGIASLESDGFTVGSSSAVNAGGVEYYWTAMREEPGVMDIGTYTGDGNSGRFIPVGTYQPEAGLVMGEGFWVPQFRHIDMPMDVSAPLVGGGLNSGGITGFYFGGFTISGDAEVNSLGTPYHYVTWNATPGLVSADSYLGDGQDNRDFSGFDHTPAYLLIKSAENEDAQHRMASLPGTDSQEMIGGDNKADRIQALNPDGFQVGKHNTVNDNGKTLYFVSFANKLADADLVATLLVDAPTAIEGDTLNFEFTIENPGPEDAPGVVGTLPIPAGTSFLLAGGNGSYDTATGAWDLGTLGGGASETLTLRVRVNGAVPGSTLDVSASASGNGLTEPDLLNNSDAVTVAIEDSADLALTTRIDPANPAVGDTVRFVVHLANNGPGDATGVQVVHGNLAELEYLSSTASNGSYTQGIETWDAGAIASGGLDSLEVYYRIKVGSEGADLVMDTGITASDLRDPSSANDSASSPLVVMDEADLTLSAAFARTAAAEGDTVQLNIVVSNEGPDAATGVGVNFTLPAGLTLESFVFDTGISFPGLGVWQPTEIAPGDTVRATLVLLVQAGTTGSTLEADILIGSSDIFDPDSSNDSVTASLPVYPPVDLTLSVEAPELSPAAGDTITLAILLANWSPNDADGVGVAAAIPDGLGFVSAAATGGAYDDGAGLWTVGALVSGQVDTLRLVSTVLPDTQGTDIVFTPEIVAADQPDPIPDDNRVELTISVRSEADLSAVAVAGEEISASQDGALQPVLKLTISNAGAVPDTLRSVAVTNRAIGEGTQDQLDAIWQELTILQDPDAVDVELRVVPAPPVAAEFSAGRALFEDLNWIIPPGGELHLTIQGAPSALAPDGYRLRAEIAEFGDLVFAQSTAQGGTWPLSSGIVMTVDGFAASAMQLIPVESDLLAVGSIHNPALELQLPANGFLPDELARLNVVNYGSAEPGSDIERMDAWADADGDLVFDPLADTWLGEFVFTGDRWELTGLSETVPTEGLRVFVSVDITETATPTGNAVRLGVPGPPDEGVGMVSDNDGPMDAPLDNPSALGISVSDRIILTSQWIHPGAVYPAAGDLQLAHLIATNTYADERTLQRITVTNTTEGADGATTAQLDATCRQVVLRLDANGNGELDDEATDPALGAGSFFDGQVEFAGLGQVLPAGTAVHFFVTADLGLMTVADGDRISAAIENVSDVDVTGSTIVGDWPLDSGARWSVDGMIAEQIGIAPVTVLTLGPDDGPALALDFTVPANGYLDDQLLGVGLANRGTADADDLALVQLWEDGGDGSFDAADAASDDTLLGPMVLQGGEWRSPVLDRLVPEGGLRLFASLTVSSTPQDSATVRFAIPTGGLTTAGGNSGPLDVAAEEVSTLVLSTSPLLSSIAFVSDEVTVSQAGEVRMTVSNRGGERVNGITPVLSQTGGVAGLVLGAPSPTSLDLDPGNDAVFTWSFTASDAGDAVLEGGASGTGQDTALLRRSVQTPTSPLTVYTPVSGLDLYPVTNLPFSINRGQVGVIPLTLTLVNPGVATVADGRLDAIRLVLRESPTGAAIAPADLLTRLVIREGTDIYADLTSLPTTAEPFTVTLDHPAVITGSEPVTLGIRFDLRIGSTVPSFLLSIDDSTWFTVSDAVSGLTVPLALGEGEFPVQSGQGNLVTQATALELAVVDRPENAAGPGQTDVVLADLDLSNVSGDDSSSAIELGALSFAFRDDSGEKLAAPETVFSGLRLSSSFQDHFVGAITADADSQIVLQLSPPVLVPGNTTLTLRLHGDLTAEPPFGPIVPLIGNLALFDARDANTGAAIGISLTTPAAAAATRILGAAETITVGGQPLLPEFIPQGAADIAALTVTFQHPGNAGIAPITVDTLAVRFTDNARHPINPSVYLDELRLMHGDAELVVIGRTDAADGIVDIPLTGISLDPGQSTDLGIHFDIRPDAPGEFFQMSLGPDGIRAHDGVRGTLLNVAPTAGFVLPIVSGTTRIVAAADELVVSVQNRLPAILAPQADPYPALSLFLANPASAESGAVAIDELTFRRANGASASLGAFTSSIRLSHHGDIWAEASLESGDETAVLAGEVPLTVSAGDESEVLLEILLRPDPPDGSIALQIDAPDIVARPADVINATVFVSAGPGQSFPLQSATATLSAADLSGSYANYPNPFQAGRESTTFVYSLPTSATVTLRLLTPHGEPVATLLESEPMDAGLRQVDQWDGRNGNGKIVRNGVYIAELTAEFPDGSRQRVLRKVAVVR